MRPWIIAHNGGMEHSAGGSMLAFRDALESGCDAIEFDVRRLRDGTLVAAHDSHVGGRPLAELDRDRYVALADGAPLLEDLLAVLGGRKLCNFELKEDGYVEQVLDLARRHVAAERVLVSSFIDQVLVSARELDADLETGLIVGRARLPPPSEDELARRLEATDARYLCLRDTLLEHGLQERAAAMGVLTLVWTVNDDETLAALLSDDDVAGVFTDYPRRAVAIRERLPLR